MDTENKMQNNQDYLLPASILIAGVLVAGAVIYSTGLKSAGTLPTGENVPEVVSGEALNLTAEDVILGDPNAPVTVIIFGDFQCPFCGRLFDTVERRLKEEYVSAGKVKLISRDFPLDQIHPYARSAAEAAECARDQGKYWLYRDTLYERQEEIPSLNFVELAEELGLASQEFQSCFTSQKYKDSVEEDYQGGIALRVGATPTVFINGQKIEGALPYDSFKLIIDAELAK